MGSIKYDSAHFVIALLLLVSCHVCLEVEHAAAPKTHDGYDSFSIHIRILTLSAVGFEILLNTFVIINMIEHVSHVYFYCSSILVATAIGINCSASATATYQFLTLMSPLLSALTAAPCQIIITKYRWYFNIIAFNTSMWIFIDDDVLDRSLQLENISALYFYFLSCGVTERIFFLVNSLTKVILRRIKSRTKFL